jgi:transcriptional regulator with XRE-family HTH domain
MPARTKVSVIHRRVLNVTLTWTRRLPDQAQHEPSVYIRALRSALRMSQDSLSKRSGVPQARICRLEAGGNVGMETLRRLFAALFCDLIVIPKARVMPSEALARRELEVPDYVWGRRALWTWTPERERALEAARPPRRIRRWRLLRPL